MRSIGARLFWTQLIASACLAVIVGALLYIRVGDSLSDQFDQALGGRATSLAALIHVGPKGVFADFDEKSLPEFSRTLNAHYLQVMELDGDVAFASKSLGQIKLPANVGDHPVRYRNLRLPDGDDGRLVTIKFTPTYDAADFLPNTPPTTVPDPLLLTFAMSREELDERLHSFGTALVIAAMTLSIGIVLVTAFAVRSGLKHLRLFAGQVEGIYIDQLDSRIDGSGVPVELQPISQRLNELLARLEGAFHRERRFTADAAHELRTPIAELRTLAEVALHKSAGQTDPHQFFQDALAVAKQMESLVEALLMLARGQTAKDTGRLQRLDLSDLAQTVWERVQIGRPSKAIDFAQDVQPGLHVYCDPVVLTSIFTNLLSNALEYTPPRGVLHWRLELIDGLVRFSLENTNDSLQPGDLKHLTEPFWRKSRARSTSSHSGLGLALVQAWSDSIHADLHFDLSPDGNLFRTTFALKQAAADVSQPAEIRDTVSVLQ